MSETKHSLKRRIISYIFLSIVVVFFIAIWLVSISVTNNPEFLFIANILFPIIIAIAIIMILTHVLVLRKLYYVKLTDDRIIINTVYPIYNFKYKEIKSISYNSLWLKGIDTGLYMNWVVAYELNNPDKFIIDFKNKYKIATKKNLIIKKEFF